MELAKTHIFNPSALEGGDKQNFISSFYCIFIVNTKQSHIINLSICALTYDES
jgi:hypothetical protein